MFDVMANPKCTATGIGERKCPCEVSSGPRQEPYLLAELPGKPSHELGPAG